MIKPSSYTYYYRFGDGLVTTGAFDDPPNTESTLVGDPLFCGDYSITVKDSFGFVVPYIVPTDNPDATWTFDFDG